MGVSGSAMATLTSAIISFLLFVILAYKYYPIPYKTKELILSFIFVLISGYAILNIFETISFMSIFIKIIYLLLVIAGISFMLVEKEHLEKIKLKMSRKI